MPKIQKVLDTGTGANFQSKINKLLVYREEKMKHIWEATQGDVRFFKDLENFLAKL